MNFKDELKQLLAKFSVKEEAKPEAKTEEKVEVKLAEEAPAAPAGDNDLKAVVDQLKAQVEALAKDIAAIKGDKTMEEAMSKAIADLTAKMEVFGKAAAPATTEKREVTTNAFAMRVPDHLKDRIGKKK
jgi:hypothetical protein